MRGMYIGADVHGLCICFSLVGTGGRMDHLQYFSLRSKGEPLRLLYSLSGTKFKDERISLDEWDQRKEGNKFIPGRDVSVSVRLG